MNQVNELIKARQTLLKQQINTIVEKLKELKNNPIKTQETLIEASNLATQIVGLKMANAELQGLLEDLK